MKKLALFCSGSGSNAESLMSWFQDHPDIRVTLMVYNRKDSGAKMRADKFGVPAIYLPNADFISETGKASEALNAFEIDFILLAGFLALLPGWLVSRFRDRILNIHPALLPDFGGKGMFGRNVHGAVKKSGITETGMSIHLVNEKYDEGKILFQATCPVWESDSETDIATRVLKLEHLHYPLVAEQFILSKS